MSDSRVYVLVLNWNGWRVTLRCLESLLRADDVRQRIVVWDNGSTDGSVEQIVAWAAGQQPADLDVPAALHAQVLPPLSKPLPCHVVAEAATRVADEGLIVIRGSRNLGYAGGNNAALRWALAQSDCSHVWILNNDVIVDRDCLRALLDAHAADAYDRPVGTVIHDYHPPHRLQAYAGQRLGRGWLVAPRHVAPGERIDYLIGASLFLSRARATALGFFNEDYFLNAEDLEYSYSYGRAFRAAHPGVEPFLVAGRIWHEESATQGRKRARHTYYFTRNLLYAARRISRLHGLTTLAYAGLRLAWALARGRWSDCAGTARGLLHYLRGIKGPMPA